jgi:hypothetical protein
MVEVYEKEGTKGVRTTAPVDEGEMVLDLSSSNASDYPTRTSIVIGLGQHAEHPIGSFVNHSCDPSCVVMGQHLVALFNLPVGLEVTFDYTENEGPLASPFNCLDCGKLLTGPPAPCRG